MAKPFITKLAVTIPAGQFQSGIVDCGDEYLVGIVMPTAWTPARVSVMVGIDDINFYDLFSFGEGSTTPAEFKFNFIPNAIIAINPYTMLMARYFRLRSGTSDEPVAQEAARVFTVTTVGQITDLRAEEATA